MDFTTITGAVVATAVVAGILAVGAVLVLPDVASWGVRRIRALIK